MAEKRFGRTDAYGPPDGGFPVDGADEVIDIRELMAEADEGLRRSRTAADFELERKRRAYEEAKAADEAFCRGRTADERTPRPRRLDRDPEEAEKPEPRRKRRRRGWFFRMLRAMLAVLILVFAALIVIKFWPRIAPLVGLAAVETSITSALPDGMKGLLPDETMGYSAIDFENAVLGEVRQKRQLVVLEQDVQVDSVISQALANLPIFAKTKTVHLNGVGVYTVDLGRVDAKHIGVDMERRIVTVTIPHAVLQYVNINPEKTTFEDTEKALLAFGDVTLTQEQQQILESSAKETMEGALNSAELLAKADQAACTVAHDLFQPLITAVSSQFAVVVALEKAAG